MSEEMNNLPQRIRNPNELHLDRFRMIFRNLRLENEIRDVDFFIQTVTIPPIQMNSIKIGNPNNYQMRPGTKLDYGTLSCTFKVDEDLNNYYQIQSWMQHITAPQSFAQANEYLGDRPSKIDYTVDSSLFSLTNEYNPNVRFDFYHIYPSFLGGIDFSLSNAGIYKSEIIFQYDYYIINKGTNF